MGEITVKDEKQVTPQQPKRKRIWWRVLLAFLGGFIFFPLSVAGTAAILGTVFTTRQVVSMFGGDPDQILGAEYQEKTILQSVQQIINDLNNGRMQTLDGINSVSPLVRTTVEDTFNSVLKGVLGNDTTAKVSWDNIKDQPFTGTGADGSPLAGAIRDELLDNITLESLVKDSGELKGIYNYLLYPTQKEAHTDEHGNVTYEDKVDSEGHVLFDKEHPYSLNYYFKGGASSFNDLIDRIRIGDVADAGSNHLLNTMSTWKISEMQTKMDTLRIQDIFSETQLSESKLLTAIKDWDLGHFGTESQVEALKVGDLFDTSASDKLMKSMENFYIGNLKGYEMKVDENGNVVRVMEEVIEGGVPKMVPKSWEITDHVLMDSVLGDSSGNRLLNSMRDKTLKEAMNTDMDSIYLRDVIDEDTYVEFNDTTDPNYTERHNKYNRLIGAIMENNRKEAYENDPDKGLYASYEAWLAYEDENGNHPHAAYNATVGELQDQNTTDKLKLHEVMDVQEGSALYAYRDKTISELGDLDINESKLADLLEKDVYVEFNDTTDPDYAERHDKYNRVIGAIMENSRKDAYEDDPEKGSYADYEAWLAYEDGEGNHPHQAYPATVGTLTDNSTIDNLALKDVVEIDEGTILNSLKDKKVGELSSISTSEIYVRDMFEVDEYVEFTDTSSPEYAARHAKYNRVVGAIVENVRHDAYEADPEKASYANYEAWLAYEDENGNHPHAEYNATAADISSQAQIDKLKIGQVIDTDGLDDTIAGNIIDSLDESGATIKTMGEKLNDLEVGKIFGVKIEGDDYKAYENYTAAEKDEIPYILYSLRNSTLDSLKSDLNDITIGQAIEIKEAKYEQITSPVAVSDGTTTYYTGTWNAVESKWEYDEGAIIPAGVNVYEKWIRTQEPTSPLIVSIADQKISDDQGIANALKNGNTLGDIIDINASSPKILRELKDTNLSAISSTVDTFTLENVIDIYDENVYELTSGTAQHGVKYYTFDGVNYIEDTSINDGDPLGSNHYMITHEKSSPIVLSLRDVQIFNGSGLQNKLDNLMIRDVLTEEQCQETNVLKALWNDNVDAEGKGAVKITEIGTAINNVKLIDILGDDIYETDTSKAKTGEHAYNGYIYRDSDTEHQYKKIKSTWYFLLTSEDDYESLIDPIAEADKYYILRDGNEYNITSMNALINNMTYHVRKESMYNLQEAGLLTVSKTTLDTVVIAGTYAGRPIGELTIDQFIAAYNGA